MDKGLIHIYCGDGKGKTTSAVGLSVRAAGRGMKVFIAQFLKSMPTGELNTLEMIPDIKILRGDENCTFTNLMNEETRKKCRISHNVVLNEGIRACSSGWADLLVLDEIIDAYNYELIDREKLIDFLANKPAPVEIILTGRDPGPEFLELADYISEIKKIKHPYDKGIAARKGIEN